MAVVIETAVVAAVEGVVSWVTGCSRSRHGQLVDLIPRPQIIPKDYYPPIG